MKNAELQLRRISLSNGESNKWYNTEIKIAKRYMKHAEQKYRKGETN